jgi:excisionase family DNA binding protein
MYTAEAAKYLGISKSTLDHYRKTPGKGPRYSHDGRHVVYDKADLDEWRESRKISSTVEYMARQ